MYINNENFHSYIYFTEKCTWFLPCYSEWSPYLSISIIFTLFLFLIQLLPLQIFFLFWSLHTSTTNLHNFNYSTFSKITVFLYFNYQWSVISSTLAFFITFVTLFSPWKHPQGILPQHLIRTVKLRLRFWCAICYYSIFTRTSCIYQVNIYWCANVIMTFLPLLLSGVLSIYRAGN